MSIQKIFLSSAAAAVAIMALTASNAMATTVPVGTYPTQSQTAFFYLTSGTPYSSTITADFGDTISGGSTSFDDSFDFTIPQNGTGSGSLSTSFSSSSNLLDISQVLIDGTSYALTTTSSGESVTANGIPIKDGVPNTIEVIGTTGPSSAAGTFTGTATFTSSAPEPTTWALMMLGVGGIGFAFRQAKKNHGFAFSRAMAG
ncbi:MAG: FxDxF family PEP-CTERM protein [Caulobacteraceae bacterium]